ncbi:MAG TPA: hypothetical protein VGD49_01835 [Longimicrobiales bacterium]
MLAKRAVAIGRLEFIAAVFLVGFEQAASTASRGRDRQHDYEQLEAVD